VRDIEARSVLGLRRTGPIFAAAFVFARMRFVQVKSEDEINLARQLFREYEKWIDVDLCFQSFEKELSELPGRYAPESGRLLLAYSDEELAGCIALRRLSEDTCEMKRLFLRPGFHGRGLGRTLAQKIIDEARAMGYARMCLDTIPGKMDKAISLYRSLGFREISPYYDSPVAGAKFMELSLR
jgi:GNAT superfamily N-acetyltransferase